MFAAQMEALTTRMLTLTRGERGQLAAALEPVDAPKLIADAWRLFVARAAARPLAASFTLAPAIVRADPALFRAIVTNLFDNALAHAPAGGALRVTGEATPGGHVLRFANPAGALTADDVTRLFERFWRKEAARTGAGEHVGLGLSLTRTFASAMGGEISPALESDGWLVLRLRGPI